MLFTTLILLWPGQVKAEDAPNYLATWGTAGTGDGQFNQPKWIKIDSQNKIYVYDSGNSRIQKFDSNGTFITKWGSAGSANGQFNSVQGFVIDSSDNIYVLDSGNTRIQKFDSNGTHLSSWANYFEDPNNPSTCPYATPEECMFWFFDPGFMSPINIAIDNSNNIYLTDSMSASISKINSSGVLQDTFTLSDSWGAGVMAFTSTSHLFVTSGSMGGGQFYCSIKKYDPAYQYLYIRFGDCPEDGYSYVSPGWFGGSLSSPPSDLYIKGNSLYAMHQDNNQIIKYDHIGNALSYWGTAGTSVGQFDYPFGITVDSNDNVYITDKNNNRVQKFGTAILDHNVSYSVIPSQVNIAGTLTGGTNQSVTDGGTAMEVRALPVRGYAFLKWSDNSIQNPRQDTNVTSDISLTAEFINLYTVVDPRPMVMTASVNRGFLTSESDPAVTKSFTFNIGFEFSNNNAKVVVPAETVVTDKNGTVFDLTSFSLTDNVSDLSKLGSDVAGSVKFGITDRKLSFSKDVSVTIPVSSAYNGRTMIVSYRMEGESDWGTETTCVVREEKCTFNTNHATSFAITEQEPTTSCTNSRPQIKSDLFQIDAIGTSAKLFFSPIGDGEKYLISYSTSPNAEEHNVDAVLGSDGVQTYTVNLLKPNSIYYFKIRGQNGCAPGEWSNIMQMQSKTKNDMHVTSHYKNAKLKMIKTLKKVVDINMINEPPKPQDSPTDKEQTTEVNVTDKKVIQKKCYLFSRWLCF